GRRRPGLRPGVDGPGGRRRGIGRGCPGGGYGPGRAADRARHGRAHRPLRGVCRVFGRARISRGRQRPPGPRTHRGAGGPPGPLCGRGRLRAGRGRPEGRQRLDRRALARLAALSHGPQHGVFAGPPLHAALRRHHRRRRLDGHAGPSGLYRQVRALGVEAGGPETGSAQTESVPGPRGVFRQQQADSNPKTDYDYLTRDEEAVAQYLADPLCGWTATSGFFVDLLTGLLIVHEDDEVGKIPKEMPVLFVNGSEDPIGDYGKGVAGIIAQFRRHDIRDVESILFEGARHEPLHEINKEEAYEAIREWLERKAAS